MTSLRKKLEALDACDDALEWVGRRRSLKRAWAACSRPDWMLWLAGKMMNQPGWPTHQELVLAVCDCAETTLVYVSAGEDRPRKAIEAARGWARGEVSIEEVQHAARAADDAVDATRTGQMGGGSRATACAAYVAYPFDADDAANSAANAVDYAAYYAAANNTTACAAYAVYAVAYAATRAAALATMADLVRSRLQPGELPKEKS